MIKEKELYEFRPVVKFLDGDSITLEAIQEALTSCANDMGIEISFYDEKVKSGGLFTSKVVNCIVVYCPNHFKDYYHFCIRIERTGKVAFVAIDYFGHSKQMEKANLAEFMENDRKGKSLSYKLGSVISQGLNTIGKNKAKLEEEQRYYNVLFDVFDTVISYE